LAVLSTTFFVNYAIKQKQACLR